MNKFCFGAIYNGRLWEKELRVSALIHVASRIYVVLEPGQLGLILKSYIMFDNSSPFKDEHFKLAGYLN